MDRLIKRKTYLDQLNMWREEKMIKVIAGFRRCGKSTLFELYIEQLKAGGVSDDQIIFVNLEDEEFSELLDYKKLHESESKYYICDTGLRNMILGAKNKDIGRQIENIVFLELFRRGYTISIGKSGRGTEIDFFALRNNETEYYQVSSSVLDENTLERELAPLRQINDNYPKYLLTLDDFAADHGGIRQLNLIDWLFLEP